MEQDCRPNGLHSFRVAAELGADTGLGADAGDDTPSTEVSAGGRSGARSSDVGLPDSDRDPNQSVAAIPGSSQLTLPSSLDSIRKARAFVRSFAAAASPAESWAKLVDDLQLAVSELVTNGVEHGNGSDITVSLASTPGRVLLEVTSGSGGPSPRYGEYSNESRTGRGLLIVRSLSTTTELSTRDGVVTISCTFRLP